MEDMDYGIQMIQGTLDYDCQHLVSMDSPHYLLLLLLLLLLMPNKNSYTSRIFYLCIRDFRPGAACPKLF